MAKALVILIMMLLVGCAARELPPSTNSSSSIRSEQPEKKVLRLALERRLLTELWLHLAAQKEKLEKELGDPSLTSVEKEVLLEMLAQIEEQQRLTILEIGDD